MNDENVPFVWRGLSFIYHRSRLRTRFKKPRVSNREAQPALLAIGPKRDIMPEMQNEVRFILWSKFHQIFGDEHLAGKVFLHFLGPRRVITVALVRQVRQHHGLDVGGCGHLPDFI